MSPLCESYLAIEQLNQVEPFYPLHVRVCEECYLVQLEEYVSPENIFTEYAYFSSYSDSWLKHASDYVDMISERLRLGSGSLAVELASNDGYLLQFREERYSRARRGTRGERRQGGGTDVASTVKFSDVKRLGKWWRPAGWRTCDRQQRAGPGSDLNDFVGGIRIVPAQGVATIEVPHLMRLMEENQYDTIYHEHFSYFSVITLERVFAAHGLVLFDLEEIPTHGGSIRIYLRHVEDSSKPVTPAVVELRDRELNAGLDRMETYADFANAVRESKRALLELLIRLRREGKSVAGYGAPGKGNTLLNYCGVRTDFLDFTVDRNSYKHGRFLPGTHIPIHPVEFIRERRPDYILILPWNLRDEIVAQLAYAREWGAKFIVPIPIAQILN
jgi:hypothetical protein